jgi:hypothetical protein
MQLPGIGDSCWFGVFVFGDVCVGLAVAALESGVGRVAEGAHSLLDLVHVN